MKNIFKGILSILDGQRLSTFDSGGAGVGAVLAVIGTGINAYLGGFDNMVQALVVFMAIDFVLGFLAAAKGKRVDSHVMFWGGVNKLLVLVMVGIGVILDRLVGMSEPYIRTAVIWFYLGREGLSIVENYGKMDLPLPGVIQAALEQLKGKGEQ